MTEAMPEPVKVTCHCGAVELRVTLSDGLDTARRCDCSFCRRRGAPAVSAPLDGLEVVKGADKLTLYQFGTVFQKARLGGAQRRQRRVVIQRFGRRYHDQHAVLLYKMQTRL